MPPACPLAIGVPGPGVCPIHSVNCTSTQALRDREEAVRNGKLCTIVFIRVANARGQEVSGYVDFGHRLSADAAGMDAVFSRRRRLMPRPTDLSFYNWETHLATANPTPNFQVGSPASGRAYLGT
jgi:hypothetical protein